MEIGNTNVGQRIMIGGRSYTVREHKGNMTVIVSVTNGPKDDCQDLEINKNLFVAPSHTECITK